MPTSTSRSHRCGIDQWPERFPADRIFPLITAGDGYLADDASGCAVACLALTPDADREFWTDQEEQEPALYLSKLARRRDAEAGLGATILRWCSDYTAPRGIEWLRLDAWKTNDKLQEYAGHKGSSRSERSTYRTVDPVRSFSDAVNACPLQTESLSS